MTSFLDILNGARVFGAGVFVVGAVGMLFTPAATFLVIIGIMVLGFGIYFHDAETMRVKNTKEE